MTTNEGGRGERENYEVTDNISYTLYIAESRQHECPKLQIKTVGEEIQALIDKGWEKSILNESLYNKLRHAGLQCLELRTQHVNLVGAFNNKSKSQEASVARSKYCGHKFRPSGTVVSKLLTEVILGSDFLTIISYGGEISFPD